MIVYSVRMSVSSTTVYELVLYGHLRDHHVCGPEVSYQRHAAVYPSRVEFATSFYVGLFLASVNDIS